MMTAFKKSVLARLSALEQKWLAFGRQPNGSVDFYVEMDAQKLRAEAMALQDRLAALEKHLGVEYTGRPAESPRHRKIDDIQPGPAQSK